MAKVILITSREFDEYKIGNYLLPFGKAYARLFLQKYKEDNKEANEGAQKGISSHLREFDEFKRWFKMGEDGALIIKKEPDELLCGDAELSSLDDQYPSILRQLFPVPKLEETVDLSAPKSKKTVDLFIQSLEKLIFNLKKVSNQSFHAGLYRIPGDNDKFKLYLAEEYPYLNEDVGAFSIQKQLYLDALIEMLLADISVDELIILSHDADWGISGEKMLQDLRANSKIMINLFRIKNVSVHCFQHDSIHSKYYSLIKDNIKNPKNLYDELTGTENNVKSFDDYLAGNETFGELEKLDKVDFKKPYLRDVVCPETFEFTIEP